MSKKSIALAFLSLTLLAFQLAGTPGTQAAPIGSGSPVAIKPESIHASDPVYLPMVVKD